MGVAHYVGVALTCCLGRSTCTPGRVSMDSSSLDDWFRSWWAESRLPGGGSVRFLLGSGGKVGVGSGNGSLILSPLMGRGLIGSGGAEPL